MGVIAFNAQPILDARKKGLKPVEMVLVSLIGRINESNHTVYANSKTTYDWLWVRGLQICVYVSPDVDWYALVRTIALQRPAFLALWDADNRQGTDVYLFPHPADIELPQNQWRWKLGFLPWLECQNQEFAWS